MWTREQAQRCKQCSTFQWEWEQNDEAWYADHFTCFGCAPLDQLGESLSRSNAKSYGRKLGLFKTRRSD